MNKARWIDPSIPLEILALKLAEECGEVANGITDSYITSDLRALNGRKTLKGRSTGAYKLLVELAHVEFLAGVMKARLRAEIDKLNEIR